MLRIRSRVLVAAMFAPCLACDADHDPTLDMIEAEREASGWWLRVVDDQFDLVTVDEELELAIVIDPVTLPKDIAGVGEGLATVEVGGPTGEPFKIKLKITVLPAGPPAE
jgi:hypothetical protein